LRKFFEERSGSRRTSNSKRPNFMRRDQTNSTDPCSPEKYLASFLGMAQHAASLCGSYFTMKAKIIVTPKKAVLDPQGKTVQTALEHMGYQGIGAVHVGKYMEIELTGSDKEAARKAIDEACHKLLSNPVIEDYKFEIE
jgi:phosphoribosylformylglycinamidine synthase